MKWKALKNECDY